MLSAYLLILVCIYDSTAMDWQLNLVNCRLVPARCVLRTLVWVSAMSNDIFFASSFISKAPNFKRISVISTIWSAMLGMIVAHFEDGNR